MLRRAVIHFALPLGCIASAVALFGGYVAAVTIDRWTVYQGLASEGGLVVLALGVASVVVLGEAIRRLFPECPVATEGTPFRRTADGLMETRDADRAKTRNESSQSWNPSPALPSDWHDAARAIPGPS